MIFRSETRYLQRSDIFLQCCILQLSDCPAFRTDQMRMCLRQHPQLILHSLGCQLMTHNQATVYQNVDCVINSSPTDMKIHFLQFLTAALLLKRTTVLLFKGTIFSTSLQSCRRKFHLVFIISRSVRCVKYRFMLCFSTDCPIPFNRIFLNSRRAANEQ